MMNRSKIPMALLSALALSTAVVGCQKAGTERNISDKTGQSPGSTGQPTMDQTRGQPGATPSGSPGQPGGTTMGTNQGTQSSGTGSSGY